ncbi:hypothetical protein [Algoriphagus antarcticus]|uniref:Uncharacterized protein n=1 Tax=Algoriphagus antarcticus TaxID=238540 RepID=A0A3E0DX89_9BACT|nr:hypothetical protein [Algoriphagus antarcticus]REG90707.1 hypothetical protein C8N25_106210 [Algoriphagus antarcticus]
MNEFHHSRLRSGIQESHRIAVQPDWAFGLRKQARLVLLPLWRKVVIQWTTERGIKKPQLTELAEELFRVYSYPQGISSDVHFELNEVLSPFVEELTISDKSILKFYFLSEDENLEHLANEALEEIAEDEVLVTKLDRIAGKAFRPQFNHYSENDLTQGILEEMREIENLISSSDLELGLDAEAIPRINEAFSDYLDLPNGEISLIQLPIEEFAYWDKVAQDEPETVGKRVHTSEGLDWAECWLLPNGELKAKGNLEDPEERDAAAILAIREEITLILRELHSKLRETYNLLDNQIHYTFFTQRKTLENILPREGVEFFIDQVEAHGSDDFVGHINLDIRRYQKKELQEWGTQISVDLDDRYWQTEDETDEFKVWVLSIAEEEIPLETKFSEEQQESIVNLILAEIDRCYQLDYGN